MRYFFAFALFAASLATPTFVRADEALFSEVAMESVFSEASSASDSVETDVASKTSSDTLDWSNLNSGSEVDRITGTSMLMDVLKAAQLDPKEKDGSVKIVIQHAGWKFPVTMEVKVDRDQILCEMLLIGVDDKKVSSEALLELLSKGDASNGGFFAFDRPTKMIQVRRSLGNRVVTARQLKNDLGRMASLAVANANVWMKLKPGSGQDSNRTDSNRSDPKRTESKTVDSQPANPKAKTPPKPAFSTVGRWSASLAGGQTFAIALTSDAKFQLVQLKAGKSTISRGKVTRSGDRLQLVGDDGVTLNCQVSQSSADRFELAILDAEGKPALKIDFKKAS